MANRDLLDWLKREKATRLRVEQLDALIEAVTKASDAEARLTELLVQIETATLTLTDIRGAAERENKERKERTDAARARIGRAEAEAKERVQAVELESAQRLAEQRKKADEDVAALKRETDATLEEVRTELATERGLLASMKAQVEEARRTLAPFMGRA